MDTKFFLSLTILLVFLSVIVHAQEESEATNPQWFGFGFTHPYFFGGFRSPFFPHPAFPRPGGAALPPLPHVNGDQIKCFEAFHAPGIASCLQDLHSFFQSHKVSIGSDCCSAIQSVEDACQYQSPFLKNLVSNQCSGS